MGRGLVSNSHTTLRTHQTQSSEVTANEMKKKQDAAAYAEVLPY